jgi:cytochrome b involved in lipid metabolism
MNPSTRRIVAAAAISATLLSSVGAAAEAATPGRTKKAKKVTYTAVQVATHNTAADCWTTINGKVYNLTRYVTKHPGGVSKITALCGADGTAAFTGQHGSSGSPAKKLATYRIGTLAGAASTPAPKATKPAKHHDDDADDDSNEKSHESEDSNDD